MHRNTRRLVKYHNIFVIIHPFCIQGRIGICSRHVLETNRYNITGFYGINSPYMLSVELQKVILLQSRDYCAAVALSFQEAIDLHTAVKLIYLVFNRSHCFRFAPGHTQTRMWYRFPPRSQLRI